MRQRRSRVGRLRGLGIFIVASIASLAPAVVPAQADAASPVLEFVSTSGFPVSFTADGGEVLAAMDGFDTEVHCAESEGLGKIIGPRATLSEYVFTGCEAVGEEAGELCRSQGAATGEIKTDEIEAELVFIDQAKHEVGMLLNPGGGTYMNFQCGAGDAVKATGSFLAPVGPINEESTSFTASLSRSGATQTPSEYENAIGEKRTAIPMGEREDHAAATTGVELSFAITTSAPLEIKAVTAAEIEAKRHEDEAAAAAAAKRRQDEEAAARNAARERHSEEVKLRQLRRTRQRSKGLARCRRKARSKQSRVRCERRVKRKHRPVRT